MNKAQTVIDAAKDQIGSPYVFGAWGQFCTPSIRQKYAGYNPDHADDIRRKCRVLSGKAEDCEGCWYEGDRVFDCRGFTHWLLEQVGIDIEGSGATSQWNTASNWSKKGDIADMPDCVCCVFKRSGKVMQHTGMHIGGGTIIHCSSGVQYGKITDKGWTDFAVPAGLYEEEESTVAVLRKGSKGDTVKELQVMLTKLGYACGAIDGAYGTQTCAAVMAFQGDHGLEADGIAGEKTLTALATAAAIAETQAQQSETQNSGKISEETLKAVRSKITSVSDELREIKILLGGGSDD